MHTRTVGLIVALATAGMLTAAPALAAGNTQAQVPLGSLFNAVTMLAPGQSISVTTAHNPCYKAYPGATFGSQQAANDTGAPFGKSYTPTGGSVSFLFPPASGNDTLAVCAGQTVTIPVPSGHYSDAYFLEGVDDGPELITVTPQYGATQGTPISAIFDDWCTTAVYKFPLTAGTTAGFLGGNRINVNVKGKTEGSLDPTYACGYWTTKVSGLDSSKTLTALQLTAAPAKAPLPSGVKGSAGTIQSGYASGNIIALTVVGPSTAATTTPASSAASATATKSGSQTSLPKTGGNQTIFTGIALVAAATWLLRRSHLAR